MYGNVNPNFTGTIRAINNNANPFGGTVNCPWNLGYDSGVAAYPTLTGYVGTFNNNCGPNDEIFGFHGNGANVVFMDGHVTFLDENIDAIVMRRLVTASERIAPNVSSAGAPISTPADY